MNAALQNLFNDLEETVEAIKDELEASSKPPVQPVVQGRLRGSVLHIQKGVPGNYKTANVSLTQAEVASVQEAVHTSPSLAGTGRPYVVGKEFNDGSVRIACVTIKPDVFGPAGGSTR